LVQAPGVAYRQLYCFTAADCFSAKASEEYWPAETRHAH
jgi:hypothetical protein